MPIRINLLADQIAAEELRRRDPVKRAILAGTLIGILVLFYSLMLQFKVMVARSEMSTYESRLKAVEDTSKQVKIDRALANEVESKSALLERFSSNRFLWGSTLDAMQRAMAPNIRLTQIQADQKYSVVELNKFLTTNITVSVDAPPKRFGLFRQSVAPAAVMTAVSNQLKQIVLKAPFVTNKLRYAVKIALTGTNAAGTDFTAKLEFSNPQAARESTSLQIIGRDYAPEPGALDDFTRKIASLSYFKERLKESETGGINTLERPPQPRIDPQEPWETRPFIPFTIECVFQDQVLANE